MKDIRQASGDREVTGIPEEVRFGDEIVGLVEYRDGTIIDTIRKVL